MFTNRLFNKETAVQSVRVVLIFQAILFAVRFVRSVLFARLLGPSQYGIFTLAFILVSIALPFISFGMTSSLSRYIPRYEQKGMLIDFLKRIQRIPLISSVLISILCVVYAKPISSLIFTTDEHSSIVIIVALTIVPTILYRLIWSTLWGLRIFLSRSLLELSCDALLLCLGLSLILYRPLAESLLVANLVAYITVVVFFGLLLGRHIAGRDDQNERLDKTDRQLYREALKYGSWMILANLGFSALGYIDRWMLNRYGGAADVGIYAVAMALASVLFLGIQLIVNVVSVNLNYLWEKGEREKIDFTINALTKFGYLVFLSSAFIVLVIIETLIRLLYGEPYLTAAHIMPYLMLMQALMVAYWLLGLYTVLMEKTYISFCAILTGLLVNVGLNLWLIPLYNVKGAAIATASSSFILFLVQNVFYYAFKIKVDRKIYLLISMGLILLIPNAVHSALLLIVLIYVAVWTNLLLSQSEKDYVWEKIKSGVRRERADAGT